MKNTTVSKRLISVPASPIRKLVPYAMEAKRQGIKVLHLNIGDPDIKTPGVMIDVLNKWTENPIRYGQSQGEGKFIDALVNYYNSLGFGFIDGKNVQVTTGGSEAISMAFFAVCQPGEEVITFEPYYANYNSYATINGVKIVPVLTKGETGFHLPERQVIEEKITKKTKAIIICNPNNPTGTVYTRDEMEMLVSICEKNNLFLISDEVYREFVYDGKKHVSILEFMKKYPDKMILLDSLSKRYSLCGARLGMFVSLNEDLIAGVLRIAQGRLSSGLIDQEMASKLSEVKDSYFKEVHKEYQARRDVLYNGLKSIPGVFLEKPEGAFYTIVKLPVKDTENFCQWLLSKFVYEKTTVMIAPAPGFYGTKGRGKNEVRIAYVLNTRDLEKAIEILRRALVEY
ncbi:MAG: pyridoxal phosphate-dependent aminotransferase [Candidatus Roizmanbacteria bacterium]|nr:pyridoxal phosphate-dependent aminotransferase [Candidatus Roizmanbacteria bacterium]MCR4312989.1 pyridoxal phosphate-dependent aminotransferase [Candidatus Roizmanbacteria bacterium]